MNYCARILIAICLSLSAQIATAVEVADMTGQELFEQYCAACHGESGRGDGPVAASMSVKVPDLTRIAERRDGEFPADQIKFMIDGRWHIDAHGPQQMPVWGYEFWIAEGAGEFSEIKVASMLQNLVDYLESIQVTTPE